MGLFKEFKTFISRGSVIDLAVGVIIGGAFQKIVSGLVNDIVMPVIGLITGGVNFNDQFAILRLPEGVTPEMVTSLDTAKELGVTTLNYGSFITAVLDFFIMAFIIFLFVRGVNKLKAKLESLEKKEEAPKEAPTTKVCPFCKSTIAIDATRCPNCTSELPEAVDEEIPEAATEA